MTADHPSPLRILVIGGSGFVSGTVARRALAAGHAVWTLTRGRRAGVDGVTKLIADRQDAAAFTGAVEGTGVMWDVVIDCIAFGPQDILQDLSVLHGKTKQLIFVSTDFVYHPDFRRFPQGEEAARYAEEGYGLEKRRAEEALIEQGGDMAWTIVRPCHIYGPGSQLGCLPEHSRDPKLIERILAGEELRLVGGGYFLQQPLLVRDLADCMLSLAGNEQAVQQIFGVAGPDVVESVTYYRIIAELLGKELRVEETPVTEYFAEHPEAAPFLCHRFYDLSRLRASDAAVPATSLEDGLAEHVHSLMAAGA